MSEGRPPLPSKIKGPASFLGVIGPSAPVEGSTTNEWWLLGLGVRVTDRSTREAGWSRREDPLGFATGFRLMISIGGIVAAVGTESR